jgi:hypothetical protein
MTRDEIRNATEAQLNERLDELAEFIKSQVAGSAPRLAACQESGAIWNRLEIRENEAKADALALAKRHAAVREQNEKATMLTVSLFQLKHILNECLPVDAVNNMIKAAITADIIAMSTEFDKAESDKRYQASLPTSIHFPM